MTFREANLLIRGINRRYRSGWEQARLIVTPNIKKGSKMEFPWEKERVNTKPPTPEELDKIKQNMQAWEKTLNKKKAG